MIESIKRMDKKAQSLKRKGSIDSAMKLYRAASKESRLSVSCNS